MKQIIKKLLEFRDERDWEKYHIPSELARALMIEAGELNELFLWKRIPNKERISEELADVLIYALYLCHAFNLEPEDIIEQKIKKNATKYPISKNWTWKHKWRSA